jgi:hypothetical protein
MELIYKEESSKMLHLVDPKYLGSYEVWWWRKVDKINWTDHVRNKEVMYSQGGEKCCTYNE